MKSTIIAVLMLALPIFGGSTTATVVDTYKFKMRIDVPRIYENSLSLGYRKYQKQTLYGELQVRYPQGEDYVDFQVKGLYNKTHKVNGSSVKYDCFGWNEGDWMAVAVGNNKTRKFSQSGFRFSFIADPSYNIGGVEEDNSLFLDLAGHGKLGLKKGYNVPYSISGSVSGTIGCGCGEYGHISPTRWYFGGVTSLVTDIAPVNGTWTATFKERKTEVKK